MNQGTLMKLCRRCYTTAARKRFYKDVSVVSETSASKTAFEVCLDGRKLKTRAGNILKVRRLHRYEQLEFIFVLTGRFIGQTRMIKQHIRSIISSEFRLEYSYTANSFKRASASMFYTRNKARRDFGHKYEHWSGDRCHVSSRKIGVFWTNLNLEVNWQARILNHSGWECYLSWRLLLSLFDESLLFVGFGDTQWAGLPRVLRWVSNDVALSIRAHAKAVDDGAQ